MLAGQPPQSSLHSPEPRAWGSFQPPKVDGTAERAAVASFSEGSGGQDQEGPLPPGPGPSTLQVAQVAAGPEDADQAEDNSRTAVTRPGHVVGAEGASQSPRVGSGHPPRQQALPGLAHAGSGHRPPRCSERLPVQRWRRDALPGPPGAQGSRAHLLRRSRSSSWLKAGARGVRRRGRSRKCECARGRTWV